MVQNYNEYGSIIFAVSLSYWIVFSSLPISFFLCALLLLLLAAITAMLDVAAIAAAAVIFFPLIFRWKTKQNAVKNEILIKEE